MIGTLIIWISLAASFVSALLYFLSVKKQKVLLMARNSFYIAIVGVVVASALLMVYILQHRFDTATLRTTALELCQQNCW